MSSDETRPAREVVRAAEQRRPALERPLRVLLIDDSVEFLASATALLRSYVSLEVVGSAASTATGLLLLPALNPDLVLIDLAMPSINGLEATRRIKQLPDPPLVIIMTLYDEVYYRTAAREAAADGFVSKGKLVSELFPTLRRLFG